MALEQGDHYFSLGGRGLHTSKERDQALKHANKVMAYRRFKQGSFLKRHVPLRQWCYMKGKEVQNERLKVSTIKEHKFKGKYRNIRVRKRESSLKKNPPPFLKLNRCFLAPLSYIQTRGVK